MNTKFLVDMENVRKQMKTLMNALECAIKTISGALALGNVLVSGSLVGQFHYYLGQPIGKLKRLQADAIKRMGARCTRRPSELGIRMTQQHRSAGDCRMMLEIIRKMAEAKEE